jgi:hypothetical protein
MRTGAIAILFLAMAARFAAAQPSEPPQGEARERAEDAYDAAFIVFEDEYAAYINIRHDDYASYGTVTTVRRAVPIRGIQRERLAPIEFYSAVGRTDLAEAYHGRQRTKAIVGGASAGAFVLTIVLSGVAMSKVMADTGWDNCDVFSPTWDACLAESDRRERENNRQARNWAIGAGASLVGSLALAAIWRGMDPQPVTENERRLLAHDYNERLRHQLRLPRRRPVSVTPFASSDGGGVMAVGTF